MEEGGKARCFTTYKILQGGVRGVGTMIVIVSQHIRSTERY